MYIARDNIRMSFDAANIINTADIIDKNTGKFHAQGIYSDTIFGPDNAFSYTCDCGEYQESIYRGDICHICNTEVRKQDVVSRLGWIVVPHNLRVFDPYFYGHIAKLLPLKDLSTAIDINGNVVVPSNSEQSLAGYSLQFVIENIQTILTTWKFKEDKQVIAKILLDNIDKLHVDKIPVISKMLRPAKLEGDTLTYDVLNNYYLKLINTCNTLKRMGSTELTELTVSPLLQVIQNSYNAVDLHLMQTISSKYGWLRNKFLANRMDCSSRCVITPKRTMGQQFDEVELPYYACVELFKLKIISILKQQNNSTYTSAEQRWFKALIKFDRNVFNIIQDEIIGKSSYTNTSGFTRKGVHVLINRNPSINKGSIMLMRITKCKEDPSDLTMSISNLILACLAGDKTLSPNPFN